MPPGADMRLPFAPVRALTHRALSIAAIGLVAFSIGSPSAPVVASPGQDLEQVSIRFAAMVGDQPFACGGSYPGVGSTEARITPADFRFYVSDVALIDPAGTAVPLALAQDGTWQHGQVALLDFEDKSGPCANGTPEVRDVVIGAVPAGAYTGLRFTLGVPFEQNHQDATIAPSPLNLTSMFWTWQGGYKFFRVDLEPDRAAMAGPMAERPQGAQKPHGAAASAPAHGAGDGAVGWATHLGSTACAAPSQREAPADCGNPNRTTVELAGFDPASSVVGVDLKALLDGTNVEVNQPETQFGCMSSPADGDCAGIMANFGLPFNGVPSPGQRLFRAK